MRMRIVIVRDKTERKPIEVVQFISGTPAEPVESFRATIPAIARLKQSVQAYDHDIDCFLCNK